MTGPRHWGDHAHDLADSAARYGGPDDRRALSVREGQRARRDAAVRQAKARTCYTIAALSVVATIMYALFGTLDVASAIPALTLSAVLIVAGLNDGRLW